MTSSFLAILFIWLFVKGFYKVMAQVCNVPCKTVGLRVERLFTSDINLNVQVTEISSINNDRALWLRVGIRLG